MAGRVWRGGTVGMDGGGSGGVAMAQWLLYCQHMKLEREYVDGKGNRFRADIVIADPGSPLFERVYQALANKARGGARQRAKALGGAIEVTVHPIIEKGSR